MSPSVLVAAKYVFRIAPSIAKFGQPVPRVQVRAATSLLALSVFVLQQLVLQYQRDRFRESRGPRSPAYDASEFECLVACCLMRDRDAMRRLRWEAE